MVDGGPHIEINALLDTLSISFCSVSNLLDVRPLEVVVAR